MKNGPGEVVTGSDGSRHYRRATVLDEAEIATTIIALLIVRSGSLAGMLTVAIISR
jgi:hypothetical protein